MPKGYEKIDFLLRGDTMKLKDKFIRFMYGRYGIDSFGKFTIWGSLIIMLIAGWTHNNLLSLIAWAGIIYSYYRMFSKKTYKRATENQKYLQMTRGIRAFFYKQRNLMTQRKTHRIYKCPTCKQKIRVPKGKGKIEIRCPKCNTTFIKRS